MSIRAVEIIDQLPDLRRYAAALVGDQAHADTLIELCLERLLAEQERLSGQRLRLALFALFDVVHDEWLRTVATPEATADTADALHRSLHHLPLEERKALLLLTVVHFTHREAAQVLRAAPEIVLRRVLAARERLRRTLSHRVLVIEDEPMMAMNIVTIMTHMGHEVCGVARTRREALTRVRETQPTLILADVRLHDGDNGIATVREIVRQHAVPVIFVTGHAHDLVAQQFRPTVVVGKPFAPRTLEAAVRRVLDGTPS
jgi:CheY-like chemotaxis protein/DNA-directed RNA polymerase specialized sigma24 family protein